MLDKLSKNIVAIISIIILAIFTIMNLFYIVQVKYNSENVLINITSSKQFITYIFICLVLLILLKLVNRKTKINKKVLFLILCIMYAITSVVWINISSIEPVDDAKTVNDIATSLANGNVDILQKDRYLEKCPHQLGMVSIFLGIYKIFRTTNYRVIQYLNVIANIVTIITTYLITQKLSKKYNVNSIVAILLVLTFIPLLLLENYIYGDYIGLACSLVGIYFIIKYKEENKITDLILSALFMLFAYIVKMNFIIVTISIIIYLFLYLIKEKSKREIIKNIEYIIIYMCIAILPFNLAKTYFVKKQNYDPMQELPITSYLYMGMSESPRANGWYGETMIEAWTDTKSSRQEYPQKIKLRIKDLLKHLRYTFKFYWYKTISGWMDPYFQSVWYNIPKENKDDVMEKIENRKLFKIGENYQKSIMLLIYGGSFFAIIKNRKNLNEELILILTVFIGGVLFHTIWEMKSRYTLPYAIMLIPASSIGTQYLIEKIKLKKLSQIKK